MKKIILIALLIILSLITENRFHLIDRLLHYNPQSTEKRTAKVIDSPHAVVITGDIYLGAKSMELRAEDGVTKSTVKLQVASEDTGIIAPIILDKKDYIRILRGVADELEESPAPKQ